VSRKHYDDVSRYAEIGAQQGARLVTGGRRADGFDKGFFWQPTLFDQVSPEMTIAREEIFGPILSIIGFDAEEDALAIANGLELGLTAGIFTRDINRALRFARDLQAGLVWVNDWFLSPVQTPHGGVKESGLGREQGMAAMRNYVQVKSVSVRI
jgi:acyl-CoA reductase-like NAD-dependent aldehyde dehydrogenase